MNFPDAVAEVLAITKRPDKLASTRKALNSAVAFCCYDSAFVHDYAEQTITIDSSEFTQSFPISEMTRFRRFKYIKRGGTKKFLTIVSDEELKHGCTTLDKYYQVGTNINVSLAALASTLDVGYFRYPPTLDSGENSTFWLLDMAPHMLIDFATAKIFKDIGDEKSYQYHFKEFKDAYFALRKDQMIGS